MSTYEYIVSQRHNRAVDQTLTQFNQLSRNHNTESTAPSTNQPPLHSEKVYLMLKICGIYKSRSLIFRRKRLIE